MPPLPLASKAELVDNELNFFSLGYNQDHTHGAFIQFYRRNRNFPLAHIFELDHSTAKEMAAISPHPVPEVAKEPRSTYHFNTLPAKRLGEFGGGSLKLKVFYMFSGIDNFIRHWCNDHSQCSRYCWYTTCAASMGYVFNPSKPYLNSRVSFRGPFCNQLIPLIFKVRNEFLFMKERQYFIIISWVNIE